MPQIWAAFQGLEADEVQVGPESYEIEVRLAGFDRNSLQDIENFNLVLADGNQVPLRTVITWETVEPFQFSSRQSRWLMKGVRRQTLRFVNLNF